MIIYADESMKVENEDSRIIKHDEGSAELIPIFEVCITINMFNIGSILFFTLHLIFEFSLVFVSLCNTNFFICNILFFIHI